jgi:hypothetical protein
MHAVPNHAELEQAFEKSFEKEPTSYSWGLFAYDDAPGAIGGGSGNFSWFDSKDELVGFLTKFPLLAHSSDSTDTELFVKAKHCLAQITAENFDQKVVDDLNKINSGVEQIQWLGQFVDLLSGESEFAKGMRKFFSGTSEKLAKSRIPEFAEFLRNWGH